MKEQLEVKQKKDAIKNNCFLFLNQTNLRLLLQAKKENSPYIPELLPNGGFAKQLLTRRRNVLYKSREKWTESQNKRA